MSLTAKVGCALAASTILAASCPAALTYHVDLAMPTQYRNEELFVHFLMYGEANAGAQDTATIKNFQTDGTHYHFEPSVGTVSGVFPGNVVLYDDSVTNHYSAYTQRVTFGTSMSFDVVLAGPQWEGGAPVTSYLDFVLDINRSAAKDWEQILVNSTPFAALEIYRDSSTEPTVYANPAITVTLIPEPGAIAVLGILGAGLRRRR